ncbi:MULTISPECIES: CDP-glycerol glycerophosphotransferase family protein [Gammaproteobacteria]|uniref:CDP-glycerol glycerophosphotransferase family protein n=1 Tax=Gammaproteobacteria TaxID=1236 RepID=UPI0014041B78|nr:MULTISPECIES: CDP-glycerol glycerophosphotransferase family protein [Gammaproteobacteria]
MAQLLWQNFLFHIKSHLALILSWVIPRSGAIWVVGSSKGLRFADNGKHFAIHARRKWPKQRIIWLSPSEEVRNQVETANIEAYAPSSLKGMWYGFRASWHVFDVSIADTHIFSSTGANKLNLWHGVTLKDLNVMEQNDAQHWLSKFHDWWYRKSARKNYFIYPNKKHMSYLLNLFNIPNENFILANLPRNQILITGSAGVLSTSEESLRNTIQSSSETIIGYFPTWRNTGQDKFLGLSSKEDISLLNDFLKQNNTKILTKWHSCSYKEYQHQGVSQTHESIDQEIEAASQIIKLPFDSDLMAFLDLCDVLISDYSSVLIDYLILERPIIQSVYDLDEYKELNGFMEDYPYFAKTSGPQVVDSESLFIEIRSAIEQCKNESSSSRPNLVELKNYYFETLQTIELLEPVLKPVK